MDFQSSGLLVLGHACGLVAQILHWTPGSPVLNFSAHGGCFFHRVALLATIMGSVACNFGLLRVAEAGPAGTVVAWGTNTVAALLAPPRVIPAFLLEARRFGKLVKVVVKGERGATYRTDCTESLNPPI